MKALYKYPQAEFPYAQLVEENRRRGLGATEFELTDTGVFDEDRYFDVFAEYAKAGEDDILIRITVANRGPDTATLHLLPTLWFRNTWSWGKVPEECTAKPSITLERDGLVRARHEVLGEYELAYEGAATPLFTENETNTMRLYGSANGTAFAKDAFHEYVVHGQAEAVNPANNGTKFAPHYVLEIGAGEAQIVNLRLSEAGVAPTSALPTSTTSLPSESTKRTNFTRRSRPPNVPRKRGTSPGRLCGSALEQAILPLRHSRLAARRSGAAAAAAGTSRRPQPRWKHLFNRDIISMPDKWEYPWFAAWDLAFHMIPFSKIDPHFAKKQLSSSCANGTCTRTARFRPTSLLSAT